jgi:hypothetical protein
LGLRLPGDDPLGLQNVVTLLASENDVHQGFRYFTPNCSGVPELSWTRDVVAALIQIVGERVEAAGYVFPPEGVAKMQFVIGKPRERAS